MAKYIFIPNCTVKYWKYVCGDIYYRKSIESDEWAYLTLCSYEDFIQRRRQSGYTIIELNFPLEDKESFSNVQSFIELIGD